MPATDWPTRARQHNLDQVVDLLAAAGVPHLVHRPRNATATAIAVRDTDRVAVADALAGAGDLRVGRMGRKQPQLPLHELGTDTGRRILSTADSYSLVGSVSYLPPTDSDAIQYACEVEIWTEDDGFFRSPRWSRNRAELPGFMSDQKISFGDLGPFSDSRDTTQSEARYPTNHRLVEPTPFDIDFPIDAVIAWADLDQPELRIRGGQYATAGPDRSHPEPEARATGYDTLRHAIRSIQAFAPWIRSVHLLTDGRSPEWLDPANDLVRVVDHREVFPDPAPLPVFNSHAIQTQLHRIPGLAQHFLYLPAGVIFGAPTIPQDFFSATGQVSIHLTVDRSGPIARDPTPDDLAFENGARLLQQEHGVRPAARVAPCPQALRVDLLTELAELFPAEWSATTASRLPGPTDIAPATGLAQYHAWFTGRAFVGGSSYSSIAQDAAKFRERLTQVFWNRSARTIYLREPGRPQADPHPNQEFLVRTLDTHYSLASRAERSS